MKYKSGPRLKLVAVLLIALGNSSVALAALPEPLTNTLRATSSAENDSADIQLVADRVGLGKEFETLTLAKQKGNDAQELYLEGRVLRRLWMVEFEVKRIVTRIEEERTIVNEAVSKIENRQQRIAGTINSLNFLSTGIISTVGNAIFIPAPPPRPTAPNILFTIAGGIDTTFSITSLVAMQGGKATLSMHSESVLAPLFDEDFKPEYSQLLWHYIADKNSQTSSSAKEQLISKWLATKTIESQETESGKRQVLQLLGKGRHTGVVTLHDLKLRQKMLSDLEVVVVQLSKDLSRLARSI